MTTVQQAEEAIVKTFLDAWGSETPVTLINERFDPPSNSPWARVIIYHYESRQETLGGVGNRRYHRTGRITVQLFSPLNQGTKRLSQLAQKAREAYEGKSRLVGPGGPSTVWIQDVAVDTGIPEAGYHQYRVNADFAYEEIR